jgi:hypothetical protein
MTESENSSLHLLFREVLAEITDGQSRQGNRQRHKIEKFAIATLLISDRRVGTRHDNTPENQILKLFF